MSRWDFEITVIGGGMVGCCLALALALAGKDVALVESKLPVEFDPEAEPDLRVSALNLASVQILQALDAWQGIISRRCCPFTRMQVWDGEAGGETCFRAADLSLAELGFIVENRIVQLALLEQLQQHPRVQIMAPAQLVSMQRLSGRVQLRLGQGDSFSTALVVGADGASSKVRELAGIEVWRHSYAMRAMVATVRTIAPQSDCTWQRFMPTGPQAFLPLAGQRASLVWYHTAEQVQALSALDDPDFLQALQQAFPPELGELDSMVSRGQFGLERMHARQYVLPRLALVGDAAHTVHPLAGQGVNLGLLDAAALAEAISTQGDPGQLSKLGQYQRMRRLDNSLMSACLHGFERAFAPRSTAVQKLRSAAMHLTNHVTPLRQLLIRHAVGIDRDD